MDAEQKEQVVLECRELMSKAKYDESKIDQFCDTVSDILQEIIDNPDDEREIRYAVKRHIDRIEFRLDVSGDRIDPFTDGKGAAERKLKNAVNAVLFNPETSIAFGYTAGWNHLVVKSPSKIANSRLLNDPMVKAMLLGIVAGIICRFLPDETRSFILDGIAAPIMTALVGLLMGIMAPVFFLFIIVSVSSFGSMDELAKTGKVIMRRFITITIWVALLTAGVALLFFPVFGERATSIDIPAIEGVLLDTLPKNFVTPFMEGQILQVILLGIVFGAALLMMGDSGQPVRNGLLKVKEWVMGVMVLMMKVMPLLPFISTTMMIANGHVDVFIQGWKYIAAALICYLLTILIEFVAVSLRCKTSIGSLFNSLKQLILMAFVTATPQATMQMSYEVSEKDLGIDHSFSDLWISLSNNLLSPSRTVALVLSVFFIADMTGMKVDVALILTMIILTVQLSFASSGTVPSATIMLNTLKLSTDMVGLFSAFEIFTRNAGAAYDITYSMLDQLDAARETGMITNEDDET